MSLIANSGLFSGYTTSHSISENGVRITSFFAFRVPIELCDAWEGDTDESSSLWLCCAETESLVNTRKISVQTNTKFVDEIYRLHL